MLHRPGLVCVVFRSGVEGKLDSGRVGQFESSDTPLWQQREACGQWEDSPTACQQCQDPDWALAHYHPGTTNRVRNPIRYSAAAAH